jgi:hypothetical protein
VITDHALSQLSMLEGDLADWSSLVVICSRVDKRGHQRGPDYGAVKLWDDLVLAARRPRRVGGGRSTAA